MLDNHLSLLFILHSIKRRRLNWELMTYSVSESPPSNTEIPSWNFRNPFFFPPQNAWVKLLDKILGICRRVFSNNCFWRVSWRPGKLGCRHVPAIHTANAESITDSWGNPGAKQLIISCKHFPYWGHIWLTHSTADLIKHFCRLKQHKPGCHSFKP